MKIICQNKKASFEYFILDKYEAGIKLKGTEIKSIRLGHISINDSYVEIKDNKVFIRNMFIGKYEYGNLFNHDELRVRELLLNKSEIRKLANKVKLEGLTIIPLKAYFKESLVKIEIGLAKGKKLYDKRETLKKKDEERKAAKYMKY